MYKSATATPEIGEEEALNLSFTIDLEKICPITIIDHIAMIKNNKGSQIGRSPDSIRSLSLKISANQMLKGLTMILNKAPVPNNAINVRI